MIKKKQLIILSEIIFLLFLMNVSFVIGPVQKEIILSRKSSETIYVDGVLTPQEWINGTDYSVILFDILDQTSTKEIWVRSVFYLDNLYVGITLEDNKPNNDFIGIIFRNNEPTPMITETLGQFWFSFGLDFKGLFIDRNITHDTFITDYGIGFENDTDVGGVNNTVAKSYVNTTHTTCEFEMPLDSGDAVGLDFKLDLGDSIDVIFYYIEYESQAVYSQLREDDADFDYNVIKIIDPDAFYLDIPLSYYILIVSGCIPIFIIIRKKKKLISH